MPINTRKKVLDNTYKLLFFLFGISLPYKDQYSTIIMLLLLGLSIMLIFKFPGKRHFKYYQLLCIPAILILPRVLGVMTGVFGIAMNELIRSLPLIIIPLIFIIGKLKNSGLNLEKYLFYGLLSGLLLFMVICEYHVIKDIIDNNEPLTNIIFWKHLNFFFTKPLDAHPGYIGLLIVYVIVIMLFTNYMKDRWKPLFVLLLLMVLGQLVARNAIIVTMSILIVFLLFKWNLKLILGFITLLIIGFLIVMYHPSDYLRKKVIYSFDFSNTKFKDKRYSRLKASISLFKKAPVFGVGPGNDNILRKAEYKKMNDNVAYNNNYNTHNQYIEYLSTYGVFGLVCFLSVLVLIFSKNNKRKYYLLLGGFMFACLTESILERSLGIKYFSILIGLIFYNMIKMNNGKNHNLKHL